MQPVLFEVFQQGAAGAMHNAFRRSGGARREQDEERMIERMTLPDKIAGAVAAYQIGEPIHRRSQPIRQNAIIECDDRCQ
jgi:hypothetical protein